MKSIFKTVDRLVTVPLLYLLITQALCFSYGLAGVLMGVAERPQDVTVPQISYFFALAVSLWAFYSLCRMDTLYHTGAMERYAEKPSYHPTHRLAFLLEEPRYWAELGLLAVLCALLPVGWSCTAVHHWLFGT